MPEPFFGLFLKQKYRNFDFVTQFLRHESTDLQSFAYHFVENQALTGKYQDFFHNFHCVRSYSFPK